MWGLISLIKNPRYREILQRAIEVEENAEKGLHKDSSIIKDFGWEWYHVQAHPAEIMKLVREGIVEITYKSSRYTHYRLVDREKVKKALSGPFWL
jgi:hypothetical protein